jgi:hypothetical protein
MKDALFGIAVIFMVLSAVVGGAAFMGASIVLAGQVHGLLGGIVAIFWVSVITYFVMEA